MAVENDYHLLVFALNDLAATINGVRDEVVRRLLQENRDGLDPNATQWVVRIATQCPLVATARWEWWPAVVAARAASTS